MYVAQGAGDAWHSASFLEGIVSEESDRQLALSQDLKAKERAEFAASLPASKADIRDLFHHLDTDASCGDTLRGGLSSSDCAACRRGVVAWLQKHGAF
jgi:hypothetical protein